MLNEQHKRFFVRVLRAKDQVGDAPVITTVKGGSSTHLDAGMEEHVPVLVGALGLFRGRHLYFAPALLRPFQS